MIAKPRVILFDWGGTLVHVTRQHDTFTPGAAGAVRVLAERGVPVTARSADNLRDQFIALRERSDRAVNLYEFDARTLLASWADSENLDLPETLDDAIDALWKPWVGCLDPIGDVVATLGRLRRQGITLGLVSNCATIPRYCRIELARQGLAELLAFSLFSSEIGLRKPHPRIYETAIARARAAFNGRGSLALEEVLFVGDTPAADIDGPTKTGMKTALVRTGSWQGEAGALVCQPNVVLDSVHDLPALWS